MDFSSKTHPAAAMDETIKIVQITRIIEIKYV